MIHPNFTDNGIAMAQVCLNCPVCNRARTTPQGAAYWAVKHVPGSLCPSCQAYARVYGQPRHAPRRGA